MLFLLNGILHRKRGGTISEEFLIEYRLRFCEYLAEYKKIHDQTKGAKQNTLDANFYKNIKNLDINILKMQLEMTMNFAKICSTYILVYKKLKT